MGRVALKAAWGALALGGFDEGMMEVTHPLGNEGRGGNPDHHHNGVISWCPWGNGGRAERKEGRKGRRKKGWLVELKQCCIGQHESHLSGSDGRCR